MCPVLCWILSERHPDGAHNASVSERAHPDWCCSPQNTTEGTGGKITQKLINITVCLFQTLEYYGIISDGE